VVPDSGAGAWTQELRPDGLRKSFILVPILARGKPIGLMDLVVYASEAASARGIWPCSRSWPTRPAFRWKTRVSTTTSARIITM